MSGGRMGPHHPQPRDPPARRRLMDLIPATPDDRTHEEATVRAIVDDGIRRYFRQRHERVDAFVKQNFSLAGSLRLHRAAIGWDIAKAPLNLTMAAPQVGLLLASKAARRLG